MSVGEASRPPLVRGLILLAASALMIAVVLGAFWLDGQLGIRLPAWLQWPGMAALVLGLALMGWAEGTLLHIARATGGFGDAPRALVVQGPYRCVRNPIYVGAFGVLLGLSWWRASLALMLVGLAFLLTMHLFITRVEEPATRRRFGEAYDDYLRRVPRWLPHVRGPEGQTANPMDGRGLE